jgi:hypothetical protein
MIDVLQDLAKQLETEYPGAKIRLDSFSSGAAYLDVVKNGRHFLLRYFPDRREFGVDEVLPGEGFLEKYALFTTKPEEAADFFRTLIDAGPSRNGASPALTTRDSPVS